METKLQSQSLSTESRDWLKGYFDGFYSATGHNHSGVYSPVGHDHSGVYSPVSHNHAGVYSTDDHLHNASQVLYHHLNGATLAAGATSYIIPSIAGLSGLNGITWPIGGYFSTMVMRINSTQPASGSLTITVMKNVADTTHVLTVPAGAAGATNYTYSGLLSWSANDLLTIKVKNNATATSASLTSWTLLFLGLTGSPV